MNIRGVSLMFFCFLLALIAMSFPLTGYAQEVDAKAALLMDYRTGNILFEKNIDEPLPMASVTKIMTLVLVLEAVDQGRIELSDTVSVSEYAASMRGTHVWLEAGEQLTLEEMLYAIAVGSANDAAVAVAEYFAGSESAFVELMNRRAQELGMTSTRFTNANGLPTDPKEQQEMSARDAATLARHAIDVPLMLNFVSTYEYTMRRDTTQVPQLWNYNRMLRRYDGVDGMKTGYTEQAGYCLVATAMKNDLRLIAVVLGSSTNADRENDIRTLLDYGYRKYHAYTVLQADEVVDELSFKRGEPFAVPIMLVEDLVASVERGEEQSINTQIAYHANLELPITKGDVIGRISATRDEVTIGTAPLTVTTDVGQAGVLALVVRMANAMIDSLLSL